MFLHKDDSRPLVQRRSVQCQVEQVSGASPKGASHREKWSVRIFREFATTCKRGCKANGFVPAPTRRGSRSRGGETTCKKHWQQQYWPGAVSVRRLAEQTSAQGCSDLPTQMNIHSALSVRMSGNSSSAVRRGRCATAPECLQKQPLIVCVRLKPSFLERFHGDWDPLERKERELLALANAQATTLTDRESRTAAMIVQVVETLVEAGLHNMEITMDTPGVEWALMYLHAKLRERVLLGAGTVLRLEQLQQAIVCGCRFAMSPVFVPDVTNRLIEYAEQHEVLFIPGAATPSECVQVATALGDGKPVKVFPADVVGGLRFVRAMAGPLGHIPLIPTSGITFDVVQEYLEAANVYAVGVSQQILPAQQISAGDWSRIHELARLWCRAVEPYARHDSNCFSSPGINA